MDYWQRRMLDTQKQVTDKGIDALNKQLRQYYKKVMQRTIDDFEAIYDKVLANAEEGKQITPADLYNLDKYYKMQAQLKDRLQQLGDKSCNAMSAAFEREYKQIYVSLIDGSVSDAAWSTIDEQAAKQVAKQIWCADGKSWSQRVWDNVDELQQALNDSLIDCAIRGKRTSDLKKELMERFGVNYRRAETLVRTEMAHIETQSARDRYKKYGINKVQVLADTDSRTCPTCEKLDGKQFDINAQMPIPVHPNCRCCIVPVVDVKNNTDIISSRIKKPIEQRNTGKGNPNAILTFGISLNNRQKELLGALPTYDSRVIVSKRKVNMSDLSALTAETGDEFAMFTKGKDRLIIRGDKYSVNVNVEMARKLAEEGYKWSGHTHPGLDFFVLQASEGDYLILEQFEQEYSVIYNSKGIFETFKKR